MKTSESDTIAAIITPIGEGGIAVLRISGPKAFAVADGVFRGRGRLSEMETQTVHFGQIVGDGMVVDEALATVFRRPGSYTAEDVVEISCHGSVFLAKKVLELIIRNGARLAEPGEFTRRAFLNGRMDLSQAEAVADLIRANSEASHHSAIAQLRGSLSNKINNIRQRLIDTCSLLELELDFSEEDLSLVEREQLLKDLNVVNRDVAQLIDSYELGKIQSMGFRVVLVGPPNVGKSSILNSLLRENRAIVTEISGTTRDSIEETVVIEGVKFNIIDTAGIRETEDVIELEGIRRTIEHATHADLILLIVDCTRDLVTQGDIDFIDQYLKRRSPKDLVVVLNKMDMVKEDVIETLGGRFAGFDVVATSTVTSEGIRDLEELIHLKTVETVGIFSKESILISNLRQRDNLQVCRGSIDRCITGIDDELSSELLVVELKSGLRALSRVIGEDISEEILNNVFSRFCIGK